MQQREVRPGNGVGATRPVTRTTDPVRDLRGQFRWLAPQAGSPKERLSRARSQQFIAGGLYAIGIRETSVCNRAHALAAAARDGNKRFSDTRALHRCYRDAQYNNDRNL